MWCRERGRGAPVFVVGDVLGEDGVEDVEFDVAAESAGLGLAVALATDEVGAGGADLDGAPVVETDEGAGAIDVEAPGLLGLEAFVVEDLREVAGGRVERDASLLAGFEELDDVALADDRRRGGGDGGVGEVAEGGAPGCFGLRCAPQAVADERDDADGHDRGGDKADAPGRP